jgi:peptidoglycan/xylan/chitin deacetylase (PgdA/CDA1 family)
MKMKKFKWPNSAAAAVSLTYDDGLATQTGNALPDLNRMGIKATFFPSGAALIDASRAPAWKQVAASGHEIGCHTINHPCDLKYDFVRPGFGLQDYSLDRMKAELDMNIKIINGFGYTSGNYVFAYPCGESALGAGMGLSYVPLIKKMFIAARGIKSNCADPVKVDLHNVPSYGVECGADGMIKIVEEARAKNGWAVFLFHGIGGEYISVTTEAHRLLLEYLHENRLDIYIERFGTVSGYIKHQK